MIGLHNDAGSAGGDSPYFPGPEFSNSSNDAPSPSRRGRVRNADFGMPRREGLLGLARAYLEVQARLWTEHAGTPAVPAAESEKRPGAERRRAREASRPAAGRRGRGGAGAQGTRG